MRIAIIRTIFFSITVFSLWAGLAVAEDTVCPQTDYELERGSLYGCHYADGISFDYTQWGSCQNYLDSIYQQEVRVMRKEKQLWIYSPTYPVLVYVKLNKKEFKKKRRDYWIAKGREYMRAFEEKVENCTEPQPDAPAQDKAFEQTPSRSDNQLRELVPEKKTQEPAQWDDWDAPAPKAKSR